MSDTADPGKRLTLELSVPLRRALRARAAVTGQTESALVRSVLAHELKEELRQAIT